MKNIKILDTDLEAIENFISYYHAHGVEKMIYKAPGFVNEDFTKLLGILEKALEEN